MYLKKNLIQMPFSSKKSFSIKYSDENDLKQGIIKLCNHLQKGTFIVQVFLLDSINTVLSMYNNSLKYKNFNYYAFDNLTFLNDLSFSELRFLNIYALNRNCLIDMVQLKDAQKNYSFQLGFDNYLEYVEIIINYRYYDEKINIFLNSNNN